MIINDKRALAYTAKVTDIRPLEGYDRVEYCQVNSGWWCIVNKDEFKIGDIGIYFEIDSLLPKQDERFAFLEKRHYRIKCIKMCKVISQGLIMPLNAFPELGNLDVNVDVTDKLNVTYYEPDDRQRKSTVNKNQKYVSMSQRHKNLFKHQPFRWLMKRQWGKELLFVFFGKKRDNPLGFPKGFPYVHKTDEERIENCVFMLENKNPFVITEKLDGTSCTYILERKKKNKFEFYVSSRNVRQLSPEQNCYHESNIYWELANKYQIEEKMKTYLYRHKDLKYVCIQGEGVGNVQGNPLKLKENELYVFNFITSDKGRWGSKEGQFVINVEFGMKWVPILYRDYILPDDLEEFKLFADGKSAVNDEVLREGLVCRSQDGQISFKNISREYMMKKKD